MRRLFGTDGIRGIVNSDLECKTAFLLGQAVTKFMGNSVLIARDTRISGQMLESALASGVMSAGGNCFITGIIPTPAVAFLVRKHKMNAGVMISASHNPPEYNGLKVFDKDGLKLPDEVEEQIEKFILSGGLFAGSQKDVKDNQFESKNAFSNLRLAGGDQVGQSRDLKDAANDYVGFICESVTSQNIDFKGLRVALDLAHGASYFTSEEALKRLGANVISINKDFSGKDINVGCGSTNLESLKKLVLSEKVDIGIAHDGDADRVMMVSKSGVEIDGDVVLSVLAKDLKNLGKLKNNTVVGTVMSNLGLKRAMDDSGIHFEQTKVGDRYVLERMRESDFCLGGEQSGHIIMLEYNTTGDGLMSAVQFLAAIKRTGKSVDEAISGFERFPQVLINVKTKNKEKSISDPQLSEEIKIVESQLGEDGRVLLRASGTEELIRVMVEAKSQSQAINFAKKIASKIK